MSWAVGFDSDWGRDIGYGVPATCDHPGCGAEIDRGLSYVCGGQPYGGEHGCGLYFCAAHLRYAGSRRDHPQLCHHCYRNDGQTFTPTPERPEWMRHKLEDESWEAWRQANPEWVSVALKTVGIETRPVDG
jgi:hypothetical protein